MGKLTILASIFALSLVPCYGDVLLMYYTAAGEIRVSGVNGKQFSLINNFNSTETISLAIHYEQDLIFIADYSKIVRIHLVNEYGNRVISGNGELFVNSTARHREELIKTLDSSQCQTGLIFTRLLFLR
jgi:hypothetical protein